MLGLLRRLAVDVTPLRAARDFRLLSGGMLISNLGTQAALVALPFQIFVISRSPALVGLLGAFELGPMIVVSLVGGALIDRYDRRPVLALAQLGIIVMAAALCLASLLGHPPVIALLLLGGVLAGSSSLDLVTRSAMLPKILGAEHLRSGLAFNYGLSELCAVIGPAIGGLLIEITGVGGTYAVDAGTCLAMLAAALAVAPQPPTELEEHPPVRRAIGDGLRFVARTRALAGAFAIDINAMTFGMPRALFAVLALTVYHAGATGTGLLYAALAAGGTLAVLSSGWTNHARRLGRIVIGAVVLWGLAIIGMGLVRAIGPAIALLAVAGWADGISAVCRATITQSLSPDHLRGRVSAVTSLVVTSGPRLGDIESGLVAGLIGALNSVVVGGVGCVLGVGAVVLRFPQLAGYDAERAMAEVRERVTSPAQPLASARSPGRPPADPAAGRPPVP